MTGPAEGERKCSVTAAERHIGFVFFDLRRGSATRSVSVRGTHAG